MAKILWKVAAPSLRQLIRKAVESESQEVCREGVVEALWTRGQLLCPLLNVDPKAAVSGNQPVSGATRSFLEH